MPTLSDGSPDALRIDAALAHWRQGDLALDEFGFAHVGDPSEPLTEATGEGGEAGPQPIVSESAGLVVVTQTCDLVRRCLERPYVEVCPLVALAPIELELVRLGKRPNLATFEALRRNGLAAHLDRVMTVEKSIVARWNRTAGCATDEEVRWFADALSRKRKRPAFPDDFTRFAQGFAKRLSEKHSKASPEGELLRSLREIRVTASPGWSAESVDLTFWFIRDDARTTIPGDGDPGTSLTTWLEKLQPAGRFVTVDGLITTLEDMTAADYVGSDRLDLDHLSMPR